VQRNEESNYNRVGNFYFRGRRFVFDTKLRRRIDRRLQIENPLRVLAQARQNEFLPPMKNPHIVIKKKDAQSSNCSTAKR
jgi:hypothetical protein